MHPNRAQCRCGRLAELERRVRVARHEHLLHRHFVGPVFGDDRGQTIEQALEPLRESALAQQQQRRMEHVRRAAGRVDVDDVDAGALGAWIDAEDAGHWREWRLMRSEEHTSELQSLMRISYAVFCLKKKKTDRRK